MARPFSHFHDNSFPLMLLTNKDGYKQTKLQTQDTNNNTSALTGMRWWHTQLCEDLTQVTYYVIIHHTNKVT